ITFTGQSSHLAHHKGHEVTQRPEFQRAFVVFSVRFVLEPRPEQELADRLVILPVRRLTCAVLRLTKRTNHSRGSHSSPHPPLRLVKPGSASAPMCLRTWR